MSIFLRRKNAGREHFINVTRILLLALAFALALPALWPGRVQAAGPDEDTPVVAAVYADPQALAALGSELDIWEVHPAQGYVVAMLWPAQVTDLRARGYRVVLDEVKTAALTRPQRMLPAQTMGIPGYPCYRTVEETFATATSLVATYPDLATWIDIGDSWEKTQAGGEPGYDLMVLRLSNAAMAGPKPKVFVLSSIHAREYAPAELITRFAEYLLENYGVHPDVTWLLDYHEIHLLLQANPDGRKKAETGLLWRKNTDNDDGCAYASSWGTDLNRNFSFHWGCCGGSSPHPCNEVYRGSAAASEPETQAIQTYVRALFPDQRGDALSAAAPVTATGVFLDIHSYSELVLWPWGFTSDVPPNGPALQTLGRKLAYFNGYEPWQAMMLYTTDGTTDDFAYGELGLAAYTFEIGTRFFQPCASFLSTILPENLPALLYAAKVARTPYQTPAGPDVLNLTLNTRAAVLTQTTVLTATLDDTRYRDSYLEPVQSIVAAEYYINTPPWVTTTTPLAYPMAALDGTFDASVEVVSAPLDPENLNVGRNLIFVRGQDAAGNWGAVSAIFVERADPYAAFTTNSPVALGETVIYTNGSVATPPATYAWDFGDGVGFSTATHPTYTYSSAGTFTVTLTVSNALGVQQATQLVQVQPAPSIYSPVVDEVMQQVYSHTLYAHVQTLSGEVPALVGGYPYTFTTRYSLAATPIAKATQYAYEYFSGLGLPTSYHTYTHSGHTLRNVIAEQPGAMGTERLFLLIAHLDSISEISEIRAPGADDNASGAATVMLAAELLHEYTLPYTVRYVLFTGEEQGLWGSMAYAADVAAAGEEVAGVLNLDMIAYNSAQLPEPVLELHTRSGDAGVQDREIAELFEAVVSGYDLDLLPHILPSNIQASDHAAFWLQGYPAIIAIQDQQDFNPYYHETEDTLDKIDMAYFTDFAKAALGTLIHMVGVMDFTYTPAQVAVLQPVTFVASAFVPAAEQVTYTWNFGDGHVGAGTTVSHTYPFAGADAVYTVILTATTSSSVHVATRRQISVAGPVLDFTYAPPHPVAGTVVTYAGDITPSVSSLTYTWDLGDGHVGKGATFTHTYAFQDEARVYTVVLTATKSDVHLATHQLIPVSGVTLNFVHIPMHPRPGDRVIYTGHVKPATLPLAYTWDFGDGGVAVMGNPITHTFPRTTGIWAYRVTMTATHPTGNASLSRRLTLADMWWTFLPLMMRPFP